ncbi:MAG: hypothetical protein JW864_00375 [Spirochaetes bacterium]|nr:hypothetical protein [Spirochaetota bacterium]
MNKNDSKAAIRQILDEFFENASQEDILELQALLEKRGKVSSLNGINPKAMASKYAKNLYNQMGLTNNIITKTARDTVRTMILQYDPNIPEEQINVLLNQWVPKKQNSWKKIPAEVLKTMIAQFTAYGRGELNEQQLKDFPKDWAKKYWVNFPEGIQRLIESHIRGRIGSQLFWNSIDEFLGRQ